MRGATAGISVVAMVLSAGCMGFWDDRDCPELLAPDLAFPLTSGSFLATDPEQLWETVVLANDTTPDLPLRFYTSVGDRFSGNWSDISHTNETRFGKVSVLPGGQSPDVGLHWVRSVQTDQCAGSTWGDVSWDLAAPVKGESAMPGQAVMVYTAGFWENGTLFYTNIKELDSQAWPRAGWYTWEGADPLPVYVYDQDRTEQPAWWKAPSSSVPPTGSPVVDGPVGENLGEVEGMYGLGYFTTIKGFNEALKGLSSTTTRVVRLAPEEAYTLPGNEDHDLYGDAIVFYIKVVEVRDLPCPSGIQDLTCTTPMLGGI